MEHAVIKKINDVGTQGVFRAAKRKKLVLNGRVREALIGYLFLIPSLSGVVIFILAPFTDAVRRSFTEAMSTTFVGFSNYKTVLQNQAFVRATTNTLRFLGICLPLLLMISLLLSVLLYHVKIMKEFLKTSFLIPLAIPAASIVLLWKIFFHQYGLVNEVIVALGGTGIDWMNTSSSFYVLVFTYIWKNTGYDMVLWIAGLNGISESLYEAASLDGAGAFAKFYYVTLPNLIPTFFIITVLSLINSFKVFREAYLIAGDYPNDSMYMLQHLFNNWFTSLDIQKMCAAAVLVAMALLLFILILQKITGEKEEDE